MAYFQWDVLLFIFRISGIAPYSRNKLGYFINSKILWLLSLIELILLGIWYSFMSRHVVVFITDDLIQNVFAVYNMVGGYFACFLCHAVILYNHAEIMNIMNSAEKMLKNIVPPKSFNWLQGSFFLDMFMNAANYSLQIYKAPILAIPFLGVCAVHYYLLLFSTYFGLLIWNIERAYREANVKFSKDKRYYFKSCRNLHLLLSELIQMVDMCFRTINTLVIASGFFSMIYSTFLVVDVTRASDNSIFRWMMASYRVSSNIMKLIVIFKACSGVKNEVSWVTLNVLLSFCTKALESL